MKRITITLPETVFSLIKKHVPARKVSAFITDAIKSKLISVKTFSYKTLDEKLKYVNEHTPMYTTSDILKAIEKGRI